MKKMKRMLVVMVVCCMIISMFCFPVSAAVTPTLRSKISNNFPYLYHGVDNRPAVKALQRFLMNMPDYENRDTLIADGLDGGFGPNVEDAVRYFQSTNGISPTGEVYTQTWGAIADNLGTVGESESNSYFTLYNTHSAQIYFVVRSGSTYDFYYYTGTLNNSAYFVTV